MNVTREVISDLWPLYQAGEASEGSRQLVEEYLKNDLEFADKLTKSAGRDLPQSTEESPVLDQELTILKKTKKMIGMRDLLLGLAIFLTLCPLTVYDTSWGRGWILRDYPGPSVVVGALAIVAWCTYFSLRRRLRSCGL